MLDLGFVAVTGLFLFVVRNSLVATSSGEYACWRANEASSLVRSAFECTT